MRVFYGFAANIKMTRMENILNPGLVDKIDLFGKITQKGHARIQYPKFAHPVFLHGKILFMMRIDIKNVPLPFF
jgi:hypothetical protein